MNIVILPGLDGTRALTSAFEAKLAADHTVTAISYPPEMSRYDDIEVWLGHVLPTEDYILVAQSFSGPLAVMIGAARPSNLQGIAFIASFAKSPRRVPAFFAHSMRVLPIQSRLMTWLAQPMLMGKWANAAFTDQFRQSLSQIPASTLATRLQEVLRVDVARDIAQIEPPCLYLQATEDRLVPPRMSQDFRHAADKVVQVDGPHFILQANPDDTAKHISQFASQFTGT